MPSLISWCAYMEWFLCTSKMGAGSNIVGLYNTIKRGCHSFDSPKHDLLIKFWWFKIYIKAVSRAKTFIDRLGYLLNALGRTRKQWLYAWFFIKWNQMEKTFVFLCLLIRWLPAQRSHLSCSMSIRVLCVTAPDMCCRKLSFLCLCSRPHLRASELMLDR
jgi:hypothetical protein